MAPSGAALAPPSGDDPDPERPEPPVHRRAQIIELDPGLAGLQPDVGLRTQRVGPDRRLGPRRAIGGEERDPQRPSRHIGDDALYPGDPFAIPELHGPRFDIGRLAPAI